MGISSLLKDVENDIDNQFELNGEKLIFENIKEDQDDEE